MRFLSVCSGIEAASVAWKPLGWEPVGFSEIEPFPCAVLKHHYPEITNYGDMTLYDNWNIERGSIDLLCGGTPCQSFSIAGLRKGMGDPRGNLSLVFVEMAAKFRPSWVVWENVPGVLSSASGADFGTLLGALTGRQLHTPKNGWRNSGVIQGIEGAYSIAWRVLDAQYCDLAQRRERVFIVGHLGDWRRASAVLFEQESVSGHPAPSRESKEASSGDTGDRATECDRESIVIDRAAFNQGENAQYDPHIARAEVMDTLVARGPHAVGYRMQAFGEYADDDKASTIKARDHKDATDLVCVHGTQDPITSRHHAHARGRNSGQENAIACVHWQQGGGETESNRAGALRANGEHNYQFVRDHMTVRRLTPIEGERLMGFPDNYTQIPWRNKEAKDCPDGPRYKAIGNSWAVTCVRWIGQRINMIEQLTKGQP